MKVYNWGIQQVLQVLYLGGGGRLRGGGGGGPGNGGGCGGLPVLNQPSGVNVSLVASGRFQ